MMKQTFISALALVTAMTGTGNTAFANTGRPMPVGNSYYSGLSNPGQLADIIERHYASGRGDSDKLSPAKCVRDGSCGTPQGFFNAYRLIDPTANLRSPRDLVAYLRRASARAGDPNTRYRMFCLVPGTPGTWEGRRGCLTRRLRPGEQVWYSHTGVAIGASRCANPLEAPRREPPPACPVVEMWVETGRREHADDETLGLYATGPAPITDTECPITIMTDAGNGTDDDGFLQACVDFCDINGARTMYRLPPTQWSTRYRLNTNMPGRRRVVVQVPRVFAEQDSAFQLWACMTRANGTQSLAVGVEAYQYRRRHTEMVATIYYAASEAHNPVRLGQSNPRGDYYWLWAD